MAVTDMVDVVARGGAEGGVLQVEEASREALTDNPPTRRLHGKTKVGVKMIASTEEIQERLHRGLEWANEEVNVS